MCKLGDLVTSYNDGDKEVLVEIIDKFKPAINIRRTVIMRT
ncbi:hypothetical protein [Terrisporobacter vanillatitrophus]